MSKNIIIPLAAIIILAGAGIYFLSSYKLLEIPSVGVNLFDGGPIYETEPGKTRTVKLYYYNMEQDRDEEGNVLCSRQGLAAVEREIPLTISPVRDAINLLLKGELTPAEEERNIVTEFPLEGLALKNAVLKDGVLTLTFDDPLNKTSGGSCRAGILWFQIEATAKQFPEVKEVKFLPEELFQP